MPWIRMKPKRHTLKARTTELKELWAKVANENLERDGDEGRAIREANAGSLGRPKSTTTETQKVRVGGNHSKQPSLTSTS